MKYLPQGIRTIPRFLEKHKVYERCAQTMNAKYHFQFQLKIISLSFLC